jgi:hypothetical protein
MRYSLKYVLPLFLLFPLAAFCQPKPFKKKNIIWFSPNEAHQINGLAVGLQTMNINDDTLTVNGLNASVGFIGMFALPYVIDYELRSRKKKTEGFMEVDTATTIINGLSASMGGEFGVTVNGLNLTVGFTGAADLNGISVTGVFTRCNSFKGICISGLHNIAKKGVGIQIGLFNTCKNLKGIQLGLWNKSGKRGLPFFNWGI